jgi:CBS domain-containing protein
MKVNDLMTREVKSCPAFSTLGTAAGIMWDNDCGCVPVIDQESRVIGMLTDRDICMAAYLQGQPLNVLPVTGAMSKQVFSCKAEDDLAFAEQTMREKKVRRLPVIDAQGHLAGIISLNDIARETEREEEAKTTPRQVTDTELIRLFAELCEPRRAVVAHAA